MAIINIPSGSWENISIDIFGEFKAAPIHQIFLIAYNDLYFHFHEVALYCTVTVKSSLIFLTALFSRYGFVKELASDNEEQFVHQNLKIFYKSMELSILKQLFIIHKVILLNDLTVY